MEIKMKNFFFCAVVIFCFYIFANAYAVQETKTNTTSQKERMPLEKAMELLRKGDLGEKTAMMDELYFRGEEAAPFLLKALKNPDKDVRIRSARLLEKLKNPKYVPQLGDVAVNDSDKYARGTALIALSGINDKSAAVWFEKSLTEEQYPGNRGIAAVGYAMVCGRDSIAVLKNSLKTEKDDLIKMYLCKALGWAGDDSGYNTAIKGLGNPDKKVRSKAVEALGFIGRKDCLPILNKLYADKAGVNALEAIKRIEYKSKKYPDNIEMLKRSLGDPFSSVRSWAAQELIWVGNPEAIGILREKAKQGNKEARNVLVWTGQLEEAKPSSSQGTGDIAYDRAVKGLDNPDSNIREGSAAFLMMLARKDSLPVLKKHLNDPEEIVRKRVLEAIKTIEYKSKKYPENMQMLKKSLDDPSSSVRNWAARELSRVGDPEAIEILKKKAGNGNKEAENWLKWTGHVDNNSPSVNQGK